MISQSRHSALPQRARFLPPEAGTPREVFALPGGFSSNPCVPLCRAFLGALAGVTDRFSARCGRVTPKLSLNAIAATLTIPRAWREPGGVYPCAVRFARSVERPHHLVTDAKLLKALTGLFKSIFQESQPIADPVSGSRFCRHGRSYFRCRPVHEEKPTWR